MFTGRGGSSLLSASGTLALRGVEVFGLGGVAGGFDAAGFFFISPTKFSILDYLRKTVLVPLRWPACLPLVLLILSWPPPGWMPW
jgi:hypothetical protein